MTNKFWIGGTATWNNTNDANWSLSSGGPNNTTHPVAGDAVFIDGNSGSGTISRLTVAVTCDSLDCNGYTGTLSLGIPATTFAVGDLRISTGMTVIAGSGALTFTGTGTQNITSNGKTLQRLTINGTGGTVKLLDNYNGGDTLTTITKGTLDLNGFTLTTNGISSANSNARSLLFNGGEIFGPPTSNFVWTTTTTTNLTVGSGGKITQFGTGTFSSASGITIPAIESYGTVATPSSLSLDSASAFTSIFSRSTVAGSGTIQFNQNTTINGDLTIKKPRYSDLVGNVSVNTDLGGTAHTVTVNGGVRIEGADIRDITAAGSSWWARGNSTNVSNNTNINFSGGGDGADYGIIGGMILS